MEGRYEEVACPECGQETKSNGRRTRTVIHAEGQVKVKRTHRLCPACGQGIFPPGPTTSAARAELSWSPGTIATLRLGSEIPFARAAKFNELTHVTLSKNSLQRLAKVYGGRLVERQAQEAQATVQIASKEEEVVWRRCAGERGDEHLDGWCDGQHPRRRLERGETGDRFSHAICGMR